MTQKNYAQIDGYFYQNEGQYRVTDTSDFKTINGQSIIGSGDITIGGGGGSYLPLTGGTLTGSLEINSTGGQYNEGIRMHPASNDWCGLVMCSVANTSSSGTDARTWGLHNNNGNLYLGKNGTTTATTCLVNIDGNWGINNTSPSYAIDINGLIHAYNSNYPNISMKSNVTECSIYYENNNSVGWAAGVGVWGDSIGENSFGIGCYTHSSQYRFYIDLSGNATAIGGITALSDARHKKVVKDIDITVSDIASMPNVLFKWTDRDDNELHAGTLAQSWESVLPQAIVKTDNEEGTLSFNYGVAALVSSITTARKVVDHESEIKALKAKINTLEEEIHELKNK